MVDMTFWILPFWHSLQGCGQMPRIISGAKPETQGFYCQSAAILLLRHLRFTLAPSSSQGPLSRTQFNCLCMKASSWSLASTAMSSVEHFRLAPRLLRLEPILENTPLLLSGLGLQNMSTLGVFNLAIQVFYEWVFTKVGFSKSIFPNIFFAKNWRLGQTISSLILCTNLT